ncbi:MAG: hypothetical protein K5790_05585 [Nitrosopumilus sp.]|uniref:hypothetical protein n=1 Tax=Nitrosopumilus sp. TaxID=2024843 RepID=UPI00247DEFE9|nr:hypothetical protein [Nitrosopumilus sp.]MCV0392751.1 hypothetical protein [Nitrosopumilus sp.]
MKKIIKISISVVLIIAAAYVIQNIVGEKTSLVPESIQENDRKDNTSTVSENSLFFVYTEEDDFIGKSESGVDNFVRYLLHPKKENMELYNSLSSKNTKQSTVVIIPLFTMLAYTNPGFYDYYAGICDESCLTVNAISAHQNAKFDYRSSAMANQVFQILGYERISDADVNQDPSILSKYDRVILLHNEYVTKKMFDAITNHPKVIYLYPNALYAEISVDEKNSTITLIRGHGYPEETIANGFDWEFENTDPYEFDKKCENWEFYEIDNGFMLNCYPEEIIFNDVKLLETIRDL